MDARQYIRIRGANENNLKNIDVDIPRNELVVLTGLSGSGKSSLAFDTIYAEGQRRYMESLSSYARQFLGQLIHIPIYPHPDITAFLRLLQQLRMGSLASAHDRRKKLNLRPLRQCHDLIHHLIHRLFCNLPSALRTMGDSHPGIEQTEIVIDLRHCPHC